MAELPIARDVYVVWGGIFENTSFQTLEPGTEELHGPFATMAEAEKVWNDRMRRMIDVAAHRLFVLKALPA